jgi:hypothetical protein
MEQTDRLTTGTNGRNVFAQQNSALFGKEEEAGTGNERKGARQTCQRVDDVIGVGVCVLQRHV